jgi:hypothetical protein
MLHTIHLFASASPKTPIKIWGQGRCTPAAGGKGATLPALGRMTVTLKAEAAGRGNEVGQTMLMRGRRRQRPGRQGSRRAAVVEPPGPGRRLTRGGAPEAGVGRGRSGRKAPCSGGQRRRTGVARGDGIGGSVDGGFREADNGGECHGVEDGGRRGRR